MIFGAARVPRARGGLAILLRMNSVVAEYLAVTRTRPAPRTGASGLAGLRGLLAMTFLAWCVLSAGTAQAQAQEVCAQELRAAIPEGAPPVRVATALVRTALAAIEPALPTDRGTSQEWADPNAAWLQRRGFLPNDWDEDAELTPDAWAGLLANLQTPYGVEPREVSGETDPDALLNDVARVLEAVASAVRPLALVATEPGNRQALVFAGVIWNWTPYPRLLVFDPAELSFGEDGSLEPLLAELGTCAWSPTAYMATNADAAAEFYLGNSEATVRILATDEGPVGEAVERDAQRDLLAFRHPALEGAQVASIGFEGAGPSVAQVTGLLASVRTNLGAFDIGRYLAFP